MKNLILIRHSKSSYEFNTKDIDRVLTQKGIENSYKIANLSRGFIADNSLILISNAERTRQTAKIFLEIWEIKNCEIKIESVLYTFDLKNLEEIVKSCANTFDNVILFGHNDAITEFVNKFGDIYIENVPTSGSISIMFPDNDWKLLSKGKTIKIIVPSN